ncbi:hypothetical protein D9611_001478 [Ephemerocybe angulata]|uniref:Uncharacterized protein n=1 Tax=Ephemerocybe angulata TaxID=980116 RepID=A0A8H5CI24_9AGAR|nr:hypothetical protein D9611_001478 [Tulosesus angulatus]
MTMVGRSAHAIAPQPSETSRGQPHLSRDTARRLTEADGLLSSWWGIKGGRTGLLPAISKSPLSLSKLSPLITTPEQHTTPSDFAIDHHVFAPLVIMTNTNDKLPLT